LKKKKEKGWKEVDNEIERKKRDKKNPNLCHPVVFGFSLSFAAPFSILS